MKILCKYVYISIYMYSCILKIYYFKYATISIFILCILLINSKLQYIFIYLKIYCCMVIFIHIYHICQIVSFCWTINIWFPNYSRLLWIIVLWFNNAICILFRLQHVFFFKYANWQTYPNCRICYLIINS